MYYFYVLRSANDQKYYYGSTANLKRRVAEHNNGKVRATKHRRPMALEYYEAYKSLGNARLREQQVKTSGSIRKALHKRISCNLQDGTGPARPPAGKPGQ